MTRCPGTRSRWCGTAADNKTYEATVDLTGDAVLSFKHVPDVTPNFTVDEFHEVDAALRKHPAVIGPNCANAASRT